MMDSLEIGTQSLLAIIGDPIEEPLDFVHLAVAGEELRRTLERAEDEGRATSEARNALARYAARIAPLSTAAQEELRLRVVPTGLEVDLERILGELEEYASLPMEHRDARVARASLMGVDEVLYVARAAVAVGRSSPTELHRLAVRARAGARELAPRLPEIWQIAEDWSVDLGEDPNYPELYLWLEELAQLAPSRVGALPMLQAAEGATRVPGESGADVVAFPTHGHVPGLRWSHLRDLRERHPDLEGSVGGHRFAFDACTQELRAAADTGTAESPPGPVLRLRTADFELEIRKEGDDGVSIRFERLEE